MKVKKLTIKKKTETGQTGSTPAAPPPLSSGLCLGRVPGPQREGQSPLAPTNFDPKCIF